MGQLSVVESLPVLGQVTRLVRDRLARAGNNDQGLTTELPRSGVQDLREAAAPLKDQAGALDLLASKERLNRAGPSCLFCCHTDPSVNSIFYQTDSFYARWDNFPATKGHVEIVPFRHVESFFSLTPEEATEAFSLIVRVESLLREDFGPDGYTIGINEGRAAGRTIDHLHIHLIPRHVGDVPDPRGGVRQVIPNCDPDSWVTS